VSRERCQITPFMGEPTLFVVRHGDFVKEIEECQTVGADTRRLRRSSFGRMQATRPLC